jgi:hypothetical protein
MPSAGIAAGLTAFIALRIAEPIGLSLQKRVQRLLHRATDHAIQVILTRSSSIEMTLPSGPSVFSSHGGSFLLSWLRLATSISARFGAASPT